MKLKDKPEMILNVERISFKLNFLVSEKSELGSLVNIIDTTAKYCSYPADFDWRPTQAASWKHTAVTRTITIAFWLSNKDQNPIKLAKLKY